MNNMTFSGRLTNEPKISEFNTSENKKGKTYRFTVAVDKEGISKEQKEKLQNEGKPTADYLPVIYTLNNENQIAYWDERLKKGQFVEISNATYETGSYEKDGQTIYTQNFVIRGKSTIKSINVAKSENSGNGGNATQTPQTTAQQYVPQQYVPQQAPQQYVPQQAPQTTAQQYVPQTAPASTPAPQVNYGEDLPWN